MPSEQSAHNPKKMKTNTMPSFPMTTTKNESPLSLTEPLDNYQVSNYNLQPQMTININIEIEGKIFTQISWKFY